MFRWTMSTSRRMAIAVAALAGAVALPAGVAQAAALDDLEACYASGDKVPIKGSGFDFGATVDVVVQGGGRYPVTANDAGRIEKEVLAPPVKPGVVRPRSFTVTATETGNPAVRDTISMFVVRTRPISNAPVTGNPRAVTTWQFAGFDRRRMIFGHFRHKGRTVRTVRFGHADNSWCGFLAVRARRIPVPTSRLRPGGWRLQLDHRRRYDAKVRPRYVVEFSIMRSPRLGA